MLPPFTVPAPRPRLSCYGVVHRLPAGRSHGHHHLLRSTGPTMDEGGPTVGHGQVVQTIQLSVWNRVRCVTVSIASTRDPSSERIIGRLDCRRWRTHTPSGRPICKGYDCTHYYVITQPFDGVHTILNQRAGILCHVIPI